MRDLFADIGVFYGKRRSKKQKERFIRYLNEWRQKQGLSLQAVRYRLHRKEAIHLVIGDLAKAKNVVAVPYDTESRILVPFYKDHPLNVKKNAIWEMVNSLIYALFEILTLFLIVRLTLPIFMAAWWQRVLIVIVDVALLCLCWKLLRHFDNRHNFDHYSQALVTAIQSASCKEGTLAYVLIDQSAAMESGIQQVAAMCKGKEVLLLQSLGNRDPLYLVYDPVHQQRAETLKAQCFPWAQLWPLEKEQKQKSPLHPFENAFLLVSGERKGKELIVAHARTGRDDQVNLERMQMVETGIRAYGRAK